MAFAPETKQAKDSKMATHAADIWLSLYNDNDHIVKAAARRLPPQLGSCCYTG